MDVIKVEPVTGDGMRMADRPFIGCRRGKREIALNIKDPEGLEIALELVRRADVMHHNMTRGVATPLGIDYQACQAVKADIIYTYAYGLEGPLSHFGGKQEEKEALLGTLGAENDAQLELRFCTRLQFRDRGSSMTLASPTRSRSTPRAAGSCCSTWTTNGSG